MYGGDTISEGTNLTYGAPQRTKLAGFIFMSLINLVLANFDERFKLVDGLSFILIYLVSNRVTEPQFSDNLLSSFFDDCEEYRSTLYPAKLNIIRFFP